MAQTFAEKILGAPAGSIVFRKPDIVLTHDNTPSILKTFQKMGGDKVCNPDNLLIVLDHNAPPTDAQLANQYQQVREMVEYQGISKFYDSGKGICHQIMSYHAEPNMIIVGSDSHTCTAGAFNALAVGIDRTETAGIWKQGETWFRVPETIKITLTGKLREGVYAKDISLWIIGMLGSDGANYMSIEYHGDGVDSLDIADRMTLANLASEMGAKNAVFPPDDVLAEFYGKYEIDGTWADDDATYVNEYTIDLNEIFPVVAVPHHVDNIKALAEIAGTKVQECVVGTCTNGRLEDLRAAAKVLEGKHVANGVQLLIIPASQKVFELAIIEGVITTFIRAGATILSTSCGPCLGTGQGIPADGFNVISTANRNFRGRMGNEKAYIYLASPVAVAHSAICGEIVDYRENKTTDTFPYTQPQTATLTIAVNDNRRVNGVWNYADADNLNTDQMFAGKLTYNVPSSDAKAIMPHLFKGFDEQFTDNVQEGDIMVAGENFGCGSSREHPAVGLAYAGISAIIVKSVNRIFFRSAINQGLAILVCPSAVDQYKAGDSIRLNFAEGKIYLNDLVFTFAPLPDKLLEIIKKKGLVNWIIAQLPTTN